MVAPITTLQASGRRATVVLLLMVRLLGRINGQLEPFVTLRVDVVSEPISARNELVIQAAELLGAELRVPSDNVTIYLAGGAAINVAHVEKDDELYFGFAGEPWRAPQPGSRPRLS